MKNLKDKWPQPKLNVNARLWFWLLCLTQLTLWTVIPSLTRGNAPFDTIEGLAWGNQWQWGYSKHPPLAAWLTALATHLGAGIIGWPVYLLGQIAAIGCFWAVWRLTQKILPEIHALIAVALLQGIIYFNLVTPKFNPTTLMTPLWALAAFTFYLALTKQKTWQWILLGLLAGLSILTKYQSALLLFSMFLLTLTTQEGRQAFLQKNIYLAFLVSLIVILPNMIWLVQHHFSAVTYAFNRVNSHQLKHSLLNNVFYPSRFALQQLGAVIPIFILFSPFYFSKRAKVPLNDFDSKFLIYIGIGPFILTLLISAIFGIYLESKWATPYFFLTGTLLVAWYQPIVTQKQLKYFAIIVGFVLFSFPIGRGSFLLFSPYLTGKAHPDAYYPGKQIASVITQQWHNTYHRKLNYVSGDHYLVANFSVYSPDKPAPYFDTNLNHAAWINEHAVKEQGAVFIWYNKNHRTIPRIIKRRYPHLKLIKTQSFNKLTKAKVKPVLITVAFLPPLKTK